MTCPDPKFQKRMEALCDFTHSEDKGLPSKVSKKSMNAWVRSIIGYMIVITLAIMGAWTVASTQRNQNKQDIAVIGTTMENMKELLTDIKANQLTKGDIYRALKRDSEEKDK